MTTKNNLPKNNLLSSGKINVRINDLNYGNHLCHTKMISIIHNARALFLKQHNLSELNCFGVGLVMLKLNIDYRSQCFFDDLLEVNIYLDCLGAKTVEFSYEVINHSVNKMAANATTMMGFFDPVKQKLTRVPQAFIQLTESILSS